MSRKIVLYLPGNWMHGNVPELEIETMIKEKCGLELFAQSGIPLNISLQEIDKAMAKHAGFDVDHLVHNARNMYMVAATKTHSFLQWLPETSQRWETNHLRTRDKNRVMFFSEFYCPDKQYIPTKYFLILEGGMSSAYSFSTNDIDISSVGSYNISDRAAIKYGDKIGIVMRQFKPLLDAFFYYQRFPETIDKVIDEIKKIADQDATDPVVIPIDLESGLVGSIHKSIIKVWEPLLNRIQQEGLVDIFSMFDKHLAHYDEVATESSRPYRDLSKWTKWQCQLDHLIDVRTLPNPTTQTEEFLYSIALTSDKLACLERSVAEKNGKMINVSATGDQKIRISFSRSVMRLQTAAYHALRDNTSLEKTIKNLARQDGLMDMSKLEKLCLAVYNDIA